MVFINRFSYNSCGPMLGINSRSKPRWNTLAAGIYGTAIGAWELVYPRNETI